MSRRLIAHVHVDGVAYGPDDEIPARVLRRIGDHAFAAPDQDDDAGSGDDDQDDGGSGGGDGAPPRSGRGSGVEAWREFAEQHDVEVPAGATRDDIIAACEAAELVEREE
ncbi:hypothetical protein K7395_24735 [Streptomyces filamentosus]|uniref:Lsr2 protein n=2 Tax=Streptomyces filamentosus TaxID=67294 RepID=A0ABY4UZD8_STRFL|nr:MULTISPECIES: hypothetical protein [Streptomyces]MYR78700.1 hypothetical protein [Streptomyces sp. SID5466]USC49696.1 hypothetical protein K7395_24735 [Streptomyces filamentosus]